MLGQVIHGYRVDRALSADKGGFGDVFFATHVESGAEAVVKVLKPEMSAHRDIVTRFFNEARAAASIHHPGIVQIHNVGYHGDRAYLLMEKLRGDDLENRLKAGAIPLDRSILFMRQAAGAIAAAHERGIVHRDLKPANLFIVRDPDVIGGERVKVLDFGIAKLSLDAGANKTQGVFGTPAYMSPEQCASSAEVDARSDLYALGCIFYELVCGRPPFGHGGIELIASHLRDAPPPPRTISPWVPPAVEAVILQLLEKNPAQRFATCAALIGALDGVAATLPPGATPSLPPQHAYPQQPSAYPPQTSYPPARSTLGGAAGAVATTPPTAVVRGNRGIIFALLAVAVAGIAIAVAVVVSSGGDKDGDRVAGTDGVADAALAVTPPVDAADAATPPTPPIDAGARPRPRDAGARPTDAALPPPPPPAIDAGVTVPPDPSKQTAQERAAKSNEDGKTAMFDSRFADAAQDFRRAIVLDPEPKYYFNLAIALYQQGRCGEAGMAADHVLKSDADASIKKKAQALKVKLDACGK